jgi:hypothetical protein
MSYLTPIKCFAECQHQTVYPLQQDQMKGFDYLAPQGSYDAVEVYGLPHAIIDLDKATQHCTKAFICTTFGTTSLIIIDDLTGWSTFIS